MIRAVRLAAVAMVAVFAAASDCGDGSPPLPTGFTIALTSPAEPVTAAPGGNVVVTIGVTRVNGYEGPITLSLVPQLSGPFSGAAVVVPAGSSSAQMTLTAAADARLGTGRFLIDGKADGYSSQTLGMDYRVSTPGTFTMSVLDDVHSVYVVRNQVVTLTVTLVRDTYTEPITLAVTPSSDFTVTNIVQPGTGNTGTITLTVKSTAQETPRDINPGYSRNVITATGPGAPTQTYTHERKIQAPEFTLAAAPETVTVVKSLTGNTNASVSISAVRDLGNVAPINVSLYTSDHAAITVAPFTINNAAVNVPIVIGPTVPVGGYWIQLKGLQGTLDSYHSFRLILTDPPSYTLSAETAPLNVTAGGNNVPDNVMINRTNFTGAVQVTATPDDPRIIITVTPSTATTANQVALTVQVPVGVTGGTHLVALKGTAAGMTDVNGSFALNVTAPAGYSLAVQTAPLNVTSNGAVVNDLVNINRTSFVGGVTVTATSDPSIGLLVNPATATNGNQVTLLVGAGNSAAVGNHTITVTGTAAGQTDVTTTFAAVVSLAAGGAPTGIELIPHAPEPNAAVNATVEFTAYLVDAQGNRTLPAAGWNIGFATVNSNVATVLLPLPDYDTTNRWRKATVRAGPQTGTSVVMAYYYNTTTGTSTFSTQTTLHVP